MVVIVDLFPHAVVFKNPLETHVVPPALGGLAVLRALLDFVSDMCTLSSRHTRLELSWVMPVFSSLLVDRDRSKFEDLSPMNPS